MNADALLESLCAEIETNVSACQVSLSIFLGSSILNSPLGSGTFVKFSTSSYRVYGILTAAHVVKKLRLGLEGQPSMMGLSKLQDGETIACSVTCPYIYMVTSIKGFYSESKGINLPDIAFILLGVDNCLPYHELIAKSSFHCLDSNEELILSDPQIISAFYRGAANKRADGWSLSLCLRGLLK